MPINRFKQAIDANGLWVNVLAEGESLRDTTISPVPE